MTAPASQFGPYTLLYPLGCGGMGEVFLARQRGEHGIQRLVAVKRMLGHLNRNEKLINLFVDEVRIAAQLNHGSIVQVIDHGVIQGRYFMAMEFVHGENLLALLARLRQRAERIPLDLMMHIAGCVCEGLDCAHTKQSIDGRHLGIVHRDISPQNILLSFQGQVKIADFGVARAAEQSHETLGGELKGKLAYMSPEQASGLSLDHRSDLYSLGVVLYEALAGRNPFTRDNPLLVLDAVRAPSVPPLGDSRPDLPVEVADLVQWVMSPAVDRRPESARNLHEAIGRTMRLHNMVVSPFDLADFLRDCFPESTKGPGHEVSLATAVGRRADEELRKQENMTLHYLRLRHPELSSSIGIEPRAGDHPPSLTSTRDLQAGDATRHRGTALLWLDSALSRGGAIKTRLSRRRGTVLAVLGLVAAAGAGGGIWWGLRPGEELPAKAPPARRSQAGSRAPAGADGALPKEATHGVKPTRPAHDAGPRGPLPARQGNLQVLSTPTGAWVTVNGRRLPGATPLTAPLAPGRHHCVVGLRGHRSWQGMTRVRPGESARLQVRLTALQALVSVRSTHPCRVQINGRMAGKTPVTQIPVSPGLARVTCRDAAAGVHETTRVTARPGELSLVQLRFGVLALNLEPWAHVTVDGRRRGTTPLRLVLLEGEHRVVLHNPDRGLRRELAVEISPSQTRRISSW